MLFQPVVSIKTGEVTAFEALLRWDHPTRGVLAPGEFIQVAEEAGLIGPIGSSVMRGGRCADGRMAAVDRQRNQGGGQRRYAAAHRRLIRPDREGVHRCERDPGTFSDGRAHRAGVHDRG